MNNETIDIIIADKAKGELKDFILQIQEADKEFLKFAGAVSEFNKKGVKVKLPKELNKTIKESNKLHQSVNKTKQKTLEVEKKLVSASRNRNKQTQEEITNNGILRRNATQYVKATSALATSYEKLSAKLNIMKRRYKDLAISQQQGKTLTKAQASELRRLEVQIRKTDTALKRVDKSVGESFRNVGNYKSAIGGLKNSFRSLLGAFGLTSGVYLFANAVRDTFKRIREFDRAMRNIAGILRTTKSEIKDLQTEIINVAGASIKTSREVAGLAESLVTLGKTKKEIKDLLKPVNDLSIALNTSGEEAAEFLVQTLNAFGATSDEAGEYADVIATIRTSTTLDFQKMRDSFQYLTPISRILNKDLAYTGSVIGVLADNGLKAEQAGRLLGTAQQKLAKQGKSLGDALKEVNDAYKSGVREVELLSVASDLFGKQAAKVGIILANNSEIIDENAEAIRNNGGALDDLVNEQLNSLDAKIKILDSSWEELILTVESGEGSFSKVINSVLTGLTQMIVQTKELEQAQSDVFNTTGTGKSWFDYIKKATPFTNLIKTDYEDLVELQRELNKGNLSGNGLNMLESMKGQSEELIKNGDLTEDQIKIYQNYISRISDVIKVKKDERKELEEQAIALGFNEKELGKYANKISLYTNGDLNKFIKENTDNLNKNTSGLKTNNEWLVNTILSKSKEYTQDQLLLKSKEELMNILKGLNKTQKTSNEVVEGSIQYYSQLISELKKLRDATATTNSEWGAQTREIEKLEKALSQLKFQFNALQSIQREGVSAIGIDEEEFGDITDAIKKAKDELDGFAEKVLSVGENSGESTTTAAEAFTFLAQQAQETLGSIGDLTDTLFERRVSKIDDLIQKNSDYYAELLAQEEYSEEQRSRIEAERDAKEAKLQAKKREEQRKQAVANKAFALAEIAINTALAVTSIASTGGGTRYADFGITAGILTALAVASGAAQAAAVIAQPIPQFKDGHLAGTHEGLAMINDQNSPFYQEVVERVDGTMEVYSDRDQIISMNKGDKVHKASTSENMILNHVLENLGISIQPQQRNEGITDAQMDRMAGKVYKAMIRGQKGKSTDFDGIASALRKQNRINKI